MECLRIAYLSAVAVDMAGYIHSILCIIVQLFNEEHHETCKIFQLLNKRKFDHWLLLFLDAKQIRHNGITTKISLVYR